MLILTLLRLTGLSSLIIDDDIDEGLMNVVVIRHVKRLEPEVHLFTVWCASTKEESF